MLISGLVVQEVVWFRSVRPEPPFRTRGWIEYGVVIGPQGSGAVGPRLGPVASAGYAGRGGAARPGLRRPRPLGARGCHVVGRRGCGRYIRGFLVSCHPQAWRPRA